MALRLLIPALMAAAFQGRVLPTAETVPMTPAESVRINAGHERLCAGFPPALDAIQAQREGYAAAADPDAHLSRWEALFAPAQQLIDASDALWNEHNSRLQAFGVYLVTGAMGKVTSGRRVPGRVDPQFSAMQAANDAIRTRQEKHLHRFWDEQDYYRRAYESRAAARERERRDKALWKRIAAAGAAALLLALLATWRYSRAVPEPALRTAPAEAALAVPALIGGNIDVVSPLGRGGMGEVYEGLDRTLRRRVALKRLRPELTGSPADLSRLLNEARLVAALRHPNVVAIHSVEKENGQVFLVFEYVDGPTLAAVIAQRRRLPWPEALRVFSGAAAALHAAHGRNIVHRDLKPGNIMLDAKGVVKVMDFGLAHEAAQAVSRLTRSGAWGTPPYMSPEQELGAVDAGADLFALNVVLYEMLTGELPFTGPNFLAQKREGVYVPVTAAAPGLPKALNAFFATAFAPEPARRFQDAAALAAAANALI